MLKRLLVLLLAVMILPVFADATWQEIQNKNKALYIDTSSITTQVLAKGFLNYFY